MAKDDEKPEEELEEEEDREDGEESSEGEEGDEDSEGKEGEGEEGKPKSKKRLLLFIALPFLLLAGVGAGLYFTGMLDGLLGKGGEEEHAEAGGDGHGGGHSASAAFLEIPPMVVNLNTEGEAPRLMRLSVQLELENEADKMAVEAVIPRIVDQFQTYLRELRVRDLRGSAGIYRLQMELLWRVNQAAAPVKVKDVLFQEMLVQ